MTAVETEFLEYATRAVATGDNDAELFLQALAPERCKLLKICAIPHFYDKRLIGAMVSDWDELQSSWDSLTSSEVCERADQFVEDTAAFSVRPKLRHRLLAD